MSGVDLSDPGVWDDSALVASWDAAVEEYQKYHSIHARGEKVEDVLAEHELAQLIKEHGKQNGVPSSVASDSRPEQEGYDEGLDEEPDDFLPSTKTQPQATMANHAAAPKSTPNSSLPSLAALPHAILGQDNDALKNAMMAWYWAGYYTGFAEGQAQAAQQMAADTTNQHAK